ncbi:MAG: hypothetical protein QOH06_4348 [Acidobacteriota bacterium]|nr:hypothetical protein [Acidobacteriota bacterium]
MSIPLQNEIHYPESDGRPMGETQIHAQVLEDLRFALVRRYADVPDVYVWGNLQGLRCTGHLPGPGCQQEGGQSPPDLQAMGRGRPDALSGHPADFGEHQG